MYRRGGDSIWRSCGIVAVLLACSTAARADLLGYWSANSPNDNFIIPNDQGNADLDGELFGNAAYTADMSGVTGLAGDYALEFGGVTEDFGVLPASEGVTYEEITITAWVKGNPTGDWTGLIQARPTEPAIGIGFNAGTGNLTYTWNNNNAETYNFGGTQPQLNVPVDEWTFVAISLVPDAATLYVGPKGGALESGTNEIPHLAQLPAEDWRIGKDNCCGTERNWNGLMDDIAIWNHRLTAGELAQLHDGSKLPTDFLERQAGLRQVPVAGTGLGTDSINGTLSNVMKGDPVETAGLSQFWYEGNMRANVDAFFDAGDTGSAANPLVAEEFASDTTWWAGSQNTGVISDLTLPNYPSGLAGTRFDGSTGADNYGVRLTGEIFVSGNGEYLIRDGIDDFALIAIDQDGNGELDELDTLTNGDVGEAGFGDILVLDDDWANIDGSDQTADFHGFANFENISADGDWRKIEIWMSEGGGGDAGIVYMGRFDDPDIFDDTNGGALTQEERDAFVIRNDQLRTTVAVVESADASAELSTNVEFVMQVGPDGNDQISVNDNDGIYTTTLGVADATVSRSGRWRAAKRNDLHAV